MTAELRPMSLPPRPSDGHKGTFGTVLIIGGQCAPPHMMIGSPALAARGALRSGAGRVVLAMPQPILEAGLVLMPSATGLALPVDGSGAIDADETRMVLAEARSQVQAVAVGPGLGRGTRQQSIVSSLLKEDGPPLIVDADALNVMADAPDMIDDRQRDVVLTPHPGEYDRLASALGLPLSPRTTEERTQAADALASATGSVVILKGHGSVISDGRRNWICDSGTVTLAVAGSGDVLTGVVAAMLGQSSKDVASCAALATWLHGRAGQHWELTHGSTGMLAEELADQLPDVIRACRDGSIAPESGD